MPLFICVGRKRHEEPCLTNFVALIRNHIQIHQLQLPPSDQNVGAIAFDTQQDLLWVGDHHVCSLPLVRQLGALLITGMPELGPYHLVLQYSARALHLPQSPSGRSGTSYAIFI